MQENKYPVKRNAELELRIEKTAFGGKGLARVGDYVIFVKDSLPGDLVKAKVFKRKSNFAEARLLEILQPSDMRIAAPCRYFAWCGGCTWQNLSYQDQLIIKREHVVDSLRHLGGIKNIEVGETFPSELEWGYRNKMEFSFADRRWLLPEELGNENISKDYALGLHIPGTFDKILDIDECLLQSSAANQILRLVDDYCRDRNLVPYGVRSHEGYLRYLVIRESSSSGELMVNLVTAYEDREALGPLAKALNDSNPKITSIVNNINSRKAQIAQGETEILLYGQDYITEKLGAFEFRISANSFFQTNTRQAENLYQTVLDFASLTGTEKVADLYCGTGTITLFLSLRSGEVTGYELAASAVEDARSNARIHGRSNVQFVDGDLLDNLQKSDFSADVIVTDPPRSGMHPNVCEQLNRSGAEKIVYVSCNPTTMARDIAIMQDKYRLTRVQPVDMFPHTYHVETVALLERC